MPFVLILLILAVVAGVCRAVLRGTVSLEHDGNTKWLNLPNSPLLVSPTHELIGIPGRMLIVGIPFTRRMHVWIYCPRRPLGDGTLRQGGHGYISGVWVAHIPGRYDTVSRIAQFLRFRTSAR
jgi:hypothetical protein